MRNLLAELAERIDVRVLIWSGAPLPVFRPSRGDVRAMVGALLPRNRDPLRVRLVRPPHALPPREDDRDRRPRRLRRRHRPDVRRRRSRTTARPTLPAAASAGTTSRSASKGRSSRTSPSTSGFAGTGPPTRSSAPRRSPRPGRRRRRADRPHDPRERLRARSLPRGDFSVLESYVGAIRSAERFVYIENQFLWSPEIVELLAEKLRNPPRDDFRILVLLPVERERRRRRVARAGRRAHPRRRRTTRGSSPARSTRAPASSATRSTSTPRSRSSTIAG